MGSNRARVEAYFLVKVTEGISQSKHAPRREITVVGNGNDPAAVLFSYRSRNCQRSSSCALS